MITLDIERPEDNFKRYNVGNYYTLTEQLKNGRIEYRTFKRYNADNYEYIPQINYDTYNEDPSNSFIVNSVTHVACSMNNIDAIIEEHEKYMWGLKEARKAIDEMKEHFNL